MRYCSACGQVLELRQIEGDRARHVCTSCQRIHYQNPRVLVGCLVSRGPNVLLCKRAQPPGQGKWGLPGGFVECGETLEQAVIREVAEETGLHLDESNLHLHVLSALHWISEVNVHYRAEAESEALTLGPECLDGAFFSRDTIPWDELAFVELSEYLRLFFREQAAGRYGIHTTHISGRTGFRREYLIGSLKDIRVDDPISSSPKPAQPSSGLE